MSTAWVSEPFSQWAILGNLKILGGLASLWPSKLRNIHNIREISRRYEVECWLTRPPLTYIVMFGGGGGGWWDKIKFWFMLVNARMFW